MKHLFSLLAIVIALSINGCAYTPSKQDFSNANYGEPPTNIEESIKKSLYGILKDPDSVQLKDISEPKEDWFLNPANFNTKFDYGWHVCAMVNGKNSYGGYTGYKQYHFFFKNNAVSYATDHSMNSGRTLVCN